MRNKSYELYELPIIADLNDMIVLKKNSNPNGIAFSFYQGKNIITKTYHQFYEDVQSISFFLQSKGIEEKHIALVGENSYEWICTFFAIVNTGNVAVLIDKELPEQEIHTLIINADVQSVFYSNAYKEFIEGQNTEKDIFSFNHFQTYTKMGIDFAKNTNGLLLSSEINVDKMCCIMFTSGTSGKNKCVMLSQRNIVEDINGSCQLFKLEGDTVALLPFHHAFGLVVGVLMPFHYGFRIHINKSLKTIMRSLQDIRPQTLFLVPLFIENFSKLIWKSAKEKKLSDKLEKTIKINQLLLKVGIDFRKVLFRSVREQFGGNLRYIICGGAKLERQYITEFRNFGREILNGYGTTECSPCVAVNRNYYHKDGSVGIKIPKSEIMISEDREVLIRGNHVMLGYYNNSEETEKVIINGWYHTGDLGYIDKDGFIYLIGRKKNLIIRSNGENVSPEEIESDFYKDDFVSEVIVYEKKGKIVAEIYPENEMLEQSEDRQVIYFDKLKNKVNKDRPLYKQVANIVIRKEEFKKNTSKKIIREYGKESR